MRLQPEIAGYVITELTDCHWEANGLLDMRRNPRVFHDRFATVNADTVVLPEWRKLAYWAGEPVEIGLAAAHGRGDTVPDATARSGGSTPPVPRAAPPSTSGPACSGPAPPRSARPPRPASTGSTSSSTAADGRLATNSVDLYVHARRDGPPAGAVSVFAQDAALAERLQALGYRQARSAATADVILARTPEKELVSACRDGGRLVLLADQPFDLDPCSRTGSRSASPGATARCGSAAGPPPSPGCAAPAPSPGCPAGRSSTTASSA